MYLSVTAFPFTVTVFTFSFAPIVSVSAGALKCALKVILPFATTFPPSAEMIVVVSVTLTSSVPLLYVQ